MLIVLVIIFKLLIEIAEVILKSRNLIRDPTQKFLYLIIKYY